MLRNSNSNNPNNDNTRINASAIEQCTTTSSSPSTAPLMINHNIDKIPNTLPSPPSSTLSAAAAAAVDHHNNNNRQLLINNDNNKIEIDDINDVIGDNNNDDNKRQTTQQQHRHSASDNERSNVMKMMMMNTNHAQFHQLLPYQQQPKQPSPTHSSTSNHYHNNSVASTAATAIGLKPTHRRGYSHGSYSLTTTMNPIQHNQSLSSTSTTANNNQQQHLPTLINQSNHLSLGRSYNTNNTNNFENISDNRIRNNLLLNPADMTSTTASGSIKKSNSTDQVDSNAEHNNALGNNPYNNFNNNNLSHQTTTTTPNDETKRAIIEIEQKIRKYKKKIAEEQLHCNENVNEYLKLTSSAQPNQSQRLKTVFEKKNQKSTQKIARFQKKMNSLEHELDRIKNGGIIHRHPKARLRDVGTNIKEGISGLSGGVIEGIKSGIHTAGETVITKPKEFFKRNTMENVEKNGAEHGEPTSTFVTYLNETEISHQQQSSNFVAGNPAAAAAIILNSNSHSHSHSTKCTSDDDDESSSITSESGQLVGVSGMNNSQTNSAHYSNSPLRMKPFKRNYTIADIDQLRARIDERTQDCLRLNEEIDTLKNQFHSECLLLSQTLQDEKFRVERLEDQLNDLTELHQKEMENLKQTISDLEEKIQYQTDERHRDVHEMLESFQTRISRMEHQQHQHLQQLVNLDSLDNSNARALVLKLVNVLLTILQVVLLVVATVANILAPFLQTRARIFTSIFVMIIFTFIFQHWPELDSWTRQKIYNNCLYILEFLPFLSSLYSYSSSSSSLSSSGVQSHANRPMTTPTTT